MVGGIMRRSVLPIACLVLICGRVAAADRTIITADLDRLGLGASVFDIDHAKEFFQSRKVKAPAADGVVVLDVIPNGPLASAGLRSFDVVTVFGKQKLKSKAHFLELLDGLRDGDGEVAVTGYRLISGQKGSSWKLGTVKVTPLPLKVCLINSMRESKDDVGGSSTVREQTAPALSELLNDVQMRFLLDGGKAVSPSLIVQWVGTKDLLGMESVQIRAGETLLDLKIRDRHFDNKVGKCWEWGAVPITWDSAQKLQAIWKSRNATLRIVGRDYRADRELSDEEKMRIKHTAHAFELRGGKWLDK